MSGFGFGFETQPPPKLDVRSLFQSGTKGYVLDPYAVTSLWTDVAGTTQAANGQMVKRADDQSGNGANATEATNGATLIVSGSKRLLRFNGTNSKLVTPSIDLTNTDAVTVVAALKKSSDAAVSCIVEFSANISTNNGTFAMFAPGTAGGSISYIFYSKGTSMQGSVTGNQFPASNEAVLVGQGRVLAGSSSYAKLTVNDAVLADNLINQAGTVFGNFPLYIGVRSGSLFFNGDLFGLIVRGKASTQDELSQMKRWGRDRLTGSVS